MYGSESGPAADSHVLRWLSLVGAGLVRSLTCRDGAVSGVVVEPVEVFAALGAEVKRACNRKKTQAVRASWAMALGGGGKRWALGTGLTCKVFQKLVLHP